MTHYFTFFLLLCYSLKSSLKMFLSTSVKNLVSPLNWRGKMRDIFMSAIIANAEKLKTFTLLQHEKCWKTFTLLQHYRVKFAQFFSWALCNKNDLIVLCWVTWSPIKTSLCLVETKSKLDTGTRTFVVQEQWRYSLKYRTKNNNRKMPNDDIVIRLK